MNGNFKNRNAKSGVSLIVVMLFMLVATIAATATYKWITAQSKSSSSRMLEREAYQSSLAGIENARAWIAWHANDAGALIKQYFDGGKKPVRMDRQLRSLQREGQSYSVWLTGVNTENSTYKLKLLSKGEARNGAASHSEVAILNVDGLYQVKVPAEKNASKVDFDYAYFGGSYNGAGNVKLTSAVINGNWYGNPQNITKNFIVTGNARLSGNNVNIGNLACVGGNLNPENNGLTGKDLYVGGNFTGNFSMSGDAYFEGNATTNEGGNSSVAGNVTLNGRFVQQPNKAFTIGENLCTTEKGMVLSQSNGDASHRPFTVNGNVWMPGNLNVFNGSFEYSGSDSVLIGVNNYSFYDKIVLGANSDSKVYIKTAYSFSDDYEKFRKSRIIIENADAENNRICSNSSSTPICEKPGRYCMWGCCKWGNVNSCKQWEHWSGESYSPYPQKTGKDGLYYLFFTENNKKEIEFKSEYNSYWNKHVASYYVDEKLFYNLWDQWNEYNYENNKIKYRYENGEIKGSSYCKKQGAYSNGSIDIDAHRPACEVMPWFKSNGTVIRNLPSQVPFECSEQVKADCDTIWKKEAGCDGSSYKVKDPLVTAKDKFASFANKGCAAAITSYSPKLVSELNSCYAENVADKTKREANLYNGYLVVEVSGGTSSTNPSGELDGKFIIIAKDPLDTQLPRTREGSFVFLYLEKGANNLKDATVKNYFIYTEDKIANGLQFNLTGTIYATAESCAGLGSLQSSSVSYSQELIDELTENGIICNNDGSPCGGASGGSGGSSGGSSGNINYGGFDPHYISMAPQLGVSLESQYESREAAPENEDEKKIDSAYIVLPRIIYLPANPKGSLRDYYNVLALNGSKLKKENVSVNSCASSDASLSVNGSLYSGTALQKGVYECKTSASGYDENVPFWVVIGSEESDVPSVRFEKESQGINSTGSAQINLIVDASEEITVKFSKSDEPEGGWKVLPASGTSISCTDNECEIKVRGTSGTAIPLYTIKTTGATSGTFTVQLKEGNGYRLGSPWLSDVHVSSNVQVNREEITDEDFEKYCKDHSGVCPEAKNIWPKGDCESSEWVTIASGIACATVQKNDKWNCVAGGTGEGKLVESGAIKSGCVAIIPAENNSFDLSTQAANTTVSLRASVFAKKQKMIVGFTGDVGTGNNPKIDILIERSTGTVTEHCDYSSNTDENKRCAIDVFQGDQVTLKLDTSSTDHKNFNYWKCENSAGNCPSGSDVLANTVYPAFTIQGSAEYSLVAHFGEVDRHCFFDEFNRSQVICDGSFDEKEYCIDNCQSGSDGVCAGVSNGPTYTKAKWNLVSGAVGNILYKNGSVSVERSVKRKDLEQSSVKVMSTVSAGLYGTMKALLQVPKATSSNDRSSARIQNSGLILRSNGNASEYMMLNVYANASGNLEVQLCNENGKNCKSSVPTDNGSSASVSANAMVMVTATLKSSDAGDVLVVEASKDNYYGSPKAYSCQFSLNEANYAKYLNRSYEYVGFGIADANFKIYGIGWKSEDYGSECHDTYPTVKCSFRAVAENGIVPTGKDVKPWLGHSAWFNSKSCAETYYYVNGTDACVGYEKDVITCVDGYRFDPSGSGLHGYKNGEDDVKTAYASLNCSVSDDEQNAWIPAGENGRAHCGKFWTGEFTECSEHKILIDVVEDYPYSSEAKCKKFDASVNLRAASLEIELESVSGTGENPDLEVFLLSKNESWGKDDFESDASKISRFGTSRRFDVVNEMTANADGFDPEHVTGICFRNNGSAVRIKSVSSNCANAVSLGACRIKYAGGSQWNIEADVSNPDKIQSFTVTRTVEGNSNSETISCEASNSCLFDGTTAKLAFADDRNPYKEDQGKSYSFKLSLAGKGNAIAEKECSVDPSTIGKITAECKIDGNSTVAQGKGLPKFSVTFTGCPDGGCQWKISTDDGKISETGTGNYASSFGGKFDGENTKTPWDVGTYLYRVESANADYPFVGCSSEFEIVAAKSSSSSDASSSSSAAVGESSSSGVSELSVVCEISAHEYGENENYEGNEFFFRVKNNENTNDKFPITLYGGQEVLNAELNANSNWTAVSLGKLSLGSYTYSLRYNGKEICAASISVVSPLSCSVDKTEIGLGESYTFTSSKVASSCWSCSFYDGEVTSSNFNLGTTTVTPSSVGQKELRVDCTCDNVAASCSQTVAVSEIAPTVECPDKLTKSVGSKVSASPKSLTGCFSTDGCDWTLKDVNSQVASGKIKNGESFSFTDANASSEGTRTYTLEVYNSKGSAECSFDVEYVAKPVYAGTICLNAQDNEANSGGSNKNGSVLEGKYLFLHNCDNSGWWYTCVGNSFKIGAETFTCSESGSEITTWSGSGIGTTPPETGSLLEIPSGTEIKNIGCSKSNKEPVTGCSTTGVTMN